MRILILLFALFGVTACGNNFATGDHSINKYEVFDKKSESVVVFGLSLESRNCASLTSGMLESYWLPIDLKTRTILSDEPIAIFGSNANWKSVSHSSPVYTVQKVKSGTYILGAVARFNGVKPSRWDRSNVFSFTSTSYLDEGTLTYSKNDDGYLFVPKWVPRDTVLQTVNAPYFTVRPGETVYIGNLRFAAIRPPGQPANKVAFMYEGAEVDLASADSHATFLAGEFVEELEHRPLQVPTGVETHWAVRSSPLRLRANCS